MGGAGISGADAGQTTGTVLIPVPAAPASPWTSPATALAIGLALAPVAAVLQSKALAPIALLALAGCVLRHRQRRGAWPWPRGAAVWAGLALFAWGALSASWALQPAKALGTSLQIGGFLSLGAAACRAVAEDDEAAKSRLMLAACGGLLAGLLLAGLDHATGNAVRAAARGLKEAPAHLHFGLKPAASAMALWLPLVAAAERGLSRAWRAMILAAGAAVLLLLPGETPKIAVLAAAVAGGATLLAPRWAPRLLGGALAAAILLMPALLGPVLAQGVSAGGLPPSAAHRLVIWDFTAARIAERPLLGWGMEASRAVPGHDANPSTEALARFDIGYAAVASRWQMLPLHPHNGALQIWLELGMPGALLGAALALLLGFAASHAARPAVATAVMSSGAATAMLSFGVWQEWWIGAELMAAAALAGMPRRQDPL